MAATGTRASLVSVRQWGSGDMGKVWRAMAAAGMVVTLAATAAGVPATAQVRTIDPNAAIDADVSPGPATRPAARRPPAPAPAPTQPPIAPATPAIARPPLSGDVGEWLKPTLC